MIHPDTVEAIVNRARVEEVISDFISLKKSGSNYKGCCPFHNEKTPSFMVSPSKGIYKCFGCGKGGNAFNFVMEHERISYVEALRFLAKKYHIDIVETQVSEEDKQRFDLRESLQIVNTFASTYFTNNLHEHDLGKAIGLSYFKERGFTEETIKKFQLGYSLEQKDAFTSHAISQGYKLEYLERTGLTVVGENQAGNSYQADRFRGRVMFPIHSLSGSVIGFGGRIVGADPEKKLAKYLNSPESEIYNKSKTLYGIYYARTEIAKLDQCILVEGYTDVISMHQAGITNVVASSGTSLTTEQIQLIQRFSNNILIIFDGDAAGIKASFRGINMILEQGLQVKVLLLPEGDDPDSFARKNTSTELRSYITEQCTDFITFKTQLFAQETKNDPIERAKLINDIVHSIALIPDAISQTVYIESCSRILQISESVLTTQLHKILGIQKEKTSLKPKQEYTKTPEVIVPTKEEPVDSLMYCEKELIRLLIQYGDESISLPFYEEAVLVSQFLYKEIHDGEMFLKTSIYKQIFEDYYIQKNANNDIQKYFAYHTNAEIVNLFAEYVFDSSQKKISPIFSKHSNAVETELNKLNMVVLDTIGTYKRRRIEEEIQDLSEQLRSNYSEEVLQKYQIAIQAKIAIAKELKHVG